MPVARSSARACSTALNRSSAIRSTVAFCAPLLSSEDNIHLVVLDGHIEGPQPHVRVAWMPSGLEVELPAVPRTDNVRVAFRPFLSAAGLVVVEHLFDAIEDAALANRSLHMRAPVFIGIELVSQPEDADLEVAARDDFAAAVGEITLLADINQSHGYAPTAAVAGFHGI